MRHLGQSWVFAAVGLLACATPAAGKTLLTASVGWDGLYRWERWAPVYITAADDSAAARNVRLEIAAPHDSSFNTRILQHLTIRPQESTFMVYVPLGNGLERAGVVLRDASTGKELANFDFDPVNRGSYDRWDVNQTEWLVGVSGKRVGSPLFDAELPTGRRNSTGPDQRIRAGYLTPGMLPDVLHGYDALDLLVLNCPDLTQLDARVQNAIVDWVRSGGRLLLWPGENLVPPDSAIAKVLPCTVGPATVVELPDAAVRSLGLVPGQQRLGARKLAPLAGARRTGALADRATLLIGREGHGQVAVLGVDASRLIFNESGAAQRFWGSLIADLMGGGGSSTRSMDDARSTAMQRVIDRLGDVPGVGRFDFGYIALVLGALMVIVGPVDWLVLKLLRRQPWTWATTAGWIGLVTAGALYAGHVLRSGDLHFRTVHIVDQVNDRVVGAMDVIGIYSPKTQVYELESPRDAWWQPAFMEPPYSWRRQKALQGDVAMEQDTHGCRPAPMTINVWNLRFMESVGGDPSALRPVVKAALRRDGNRLRGTITNAGGGTLRNVLIRVRDGCVQPRKFREHRPPGQAGAMVTEIKPGQTVQIDDVIVGSEELERARQRLRDRWGHSADEQSPLVFILSAGELSERIARRAETAVEDRGQAVLYAEGDLPAPAVKIKAPGGPAIERHWQVVRAVVDVQ